LLQYPLFSFRFSQFFICPTFDESATNREIQAVHSEYINGKNQDERRFQYFKQVNEHERKSSIFSLIPFFRLLTFLQFICNPNHPFQSFGVGSNETLNGDARKKNISPREAALAFWEKNYSANAMTVAILGRQSLGNGEDGCEIRNSDISIYFSSENLQSLLERYFSTIVNKNKSLTFPNFGTPLFQSNQLPCW
jgi:insulysin